MDIFFSFMCTFKSGMYTPSISGYKIPFLPSLPLALPTSKSSGPMYNGIFSAMRSNAFAHLNDRFLPSVSLKDSVKSTAPTNIHAYRQCSISINHSHYSFSAWCYFFTASQPCFLWNLNNNSYEKPP